MQRTHNINTVPLIVRQDPGLIYSIEKFSWIFFYPAIYICYLFAFYMFYAHLILVFETNLQPDTVT